MVFLGTKTVVVPEVMKAMVLVGHGGIEKLEYREDYPTPTPCAGEVLVEVKACGINNTDINTRTAWYSTIVKEGVTNSGAKKGFGSYHLSDATWGGRPLELPRIQGADAVGCIVAVGEGVSSTRLGERVMVDGWLRDPQDISNPSKARFFGSECDGGFAQFATLPSQNAYSVNCELSNVELATFGAAYSTAENLLRKTRLRENETLLVTGASGGVGGAMIQLAKCRGARVIALTSRAKFDSVSELGADVCIDRDERDLPAALRDAKELETVDVVGDVVGGGLFGRLIDVLRPGGRYGTSGAIAGPEVAFNLRHLIYRDLEFYGATFQAQDIFAIVVRYIEQGAIKPIVAKTFPLFELGRAQTEFIEKQHTGNFVIEI